MHEALTKALKLQTRHGYFWARGLSQYDRRTGHELGKRCSDLKDGRYVEVIEPDGYYDTETNRHADKMRLTEKGLAVLVAIGYWEER